MPKGKCRHADRPINHCIDCVQLYTRQSHDFSRYVLPASEDELKLQTTRLMSDRISTDSESTASSPGSSDDSPISSGSTMTSASSVALPDDGEISQKGRTDSHDLPGFRARLLQEFSTIASFKNDLGLPQGDLKGLDSDAYEQLEARLSVDDQ